MPSPKPVERYPTHQQQSGQTGDTNEVDDLCAIAGIRAAGFKTDHDFGDADMRRLNIKRGVPVEDPEKTAKPATRLKISRRA